MSKKAVLVLSVILTSCTFFLSAAQEPSKIGVVNFKNCMENSKLGKQEISRLEEVQKQLETTLKAKQKEYDDMSLKFNEEYLDTLTPKAEEELKERFESLSREISQLQNQFYSLLNQAQYQVIGKLTQTVSEAATVVAKQKGLQLALNDDACLFSAPELDITPHVIAEMDVQFAKEAEKTKAAAK
ncbi:MAG: OmpH family outer membrane protein [Verrucomicrobia bacterium]|nr:OmpH family outer membrane protein [Verrucomicrobiota bacterium]